MCFGSPLATSTMYLGDTWYGFTLYKPKQCFSMEVKGLRNTGSLCWWRRRQPRWQLTCRFKQPIGMCTEFDNVVYFCDAQTNSRRLFTPMKNCAKFLSSIGKLYNAFSVHNKGASYTVKSLSEALELGGICRETLDRNAADIRSNAALSGALNGPQGHVSAKTVESVYFMEWGIKRLREILNRSNYSYCNLLSYDIRSTVHRKQPNMSMLEYSSSFGTTIKESMKRITKCGLRITIPGTSHGIQHRRVLCISLKCPQFTQFLSMSSENTEIIRNWATSYGAAVRQRTVRQETTMAKHGALPDMYQ